MGKTSMMTAISELRGLSSKKNRVSVVEVYSAVLKYANSLKDLSIALRDRGDEDGADEYDLIASDIYLVCSALENTTAINP